MKHIINGQPVEVSQGARIFRKMVNGKLVNMTSEEIAAQQAMEAEWEGQRTRAQIIEQIRELELLETPRRISEAILGIDDGWFANNRSQIAALREQLESNKRKNK